ncbi:hypothetical protein [Methylobacterium sp. 77]|uniref:hypothetical protein n=1 Tax=Methylobacterium sp. 77 TaxID=1101192 RepID=UPI00035DB183|nr:hypothetical protein [Methylobacterium sp. 77]
MIDAEWSQMIEPILHTPILGASFRLHQLNLPRKDVGASVDLAGHSVDGTIKVVPFMGSTEDWERFAQACDASFWCAGGGMRMWQMKLHSLFHLRRFEVFAVRRGAGECKIGQCAVGIGPRIKAFSDGLHLLPAFAPLWPKAMKAVLDTLGPGRYVYGSFWSTEEPRERMLEAMTGVELVASRPLAVEAVDFARWPQWDDFLKTISKNVLRNARKSSVTEMPARSGAEAVLSLPVALGLRGTMYNRKSIAFSQSWAAAGYVLRCLMLHRHVSTTIAYGDRAPLATAGTVAFGRNVYYLDGGSREDCAGAGWALILHLLKSLHDAQPRGRFLLGYTDLAAGFSESEWTSPVRYRRDCRATATETSIVAFDVGGRKAGGAAIPELLLQRTIPCWTGPYTPSKC